MHLTTRSFAVLGTAMLLASGAYSATVTVTPATKYQTIIGFGGGAVYYQNWLTAHPNKAEIYDTMFTALGTSLLRLGNWNQDSTTSIAIDSQIVAEGKARLGSRLKIFMSSWSAPAYLKVSGTVDGGQTDTTQNTLLKENGTYVYAKFAHWWRRSIERYQAAGMGPDFISIQNEPDMNADYESTLFGKKENLTAGYPQALKAVADTVAKMAAKPVLYGPEPLGIGYSNFQGYANNLDATLLGGWSYHLYHGNTNNSKYDDPDGFNTILTTLSTTYTGKPFIMSEFCPMRDTHPSSDMLVVAKVILNLLTYGNASGYINWELMWGGSTSSIGQMVGVENPWDSGSWTTTKGYMIQPEYHGVRQFSKFIAPGWRRVASSSDVSTVRSGAFMNGAADSITVVLINTATSASTMTVAPTGFKAQEAWQSVVNGAMSSKLTLTSGQVSFALPASSVTTIVYKNTATNIIEMRANSTQTADHYQVLDLLGRPVSVVKTLPTHLPEGRWIVVARDARGNKLSSWLQEGMK